VNLQRITRIQVAIAGLAVVAGIALVFIFVFIRPLSTDIASVIAAAEQDEAYAATRGNKEALLEDEQLKAAEIEEQYDGIVATRMPTLELSDPIAGMIRLWEVPAEEERIVRNWFDSTGAEVTGYGFPEFGVTPADITQLMLPPQNWNLTVQVPNLDALLEWLETLPDAPRFLVLQSVSIQGMRQPGQPLIASVPVTYYAWTGVEPTGGGGAAAEAGAAGATEAPGAAGPGRRGPRGGPRGGGPGRRGGRRGGMGGPMRGF
jgi:hypothetical protein